MLFKCSLIWKRLRLVSGNHKNRRREDSEPGKDCCERNAIIRSTVVEKKNPPCMQISHAYQENKSCEQVLSGHCSSWALNVIRKKYGRLHNEEYAEMNLIYGQVVGNGDIAQRM